MILGDGTTATTKPLPPRQTTGTQLPTRNAGVENGASLVQPIRLQDEADELLIPAW